MYYYLNSTGEETNLQLYALRHAKCLWKELCNDYSHDGQKTECLQERCVLIFATLGLSIAQLLGQNDPKFGSDVRSPKVIFSDFVEKHNLNPELKVRFDDFNNLYNGCRHFGQTSNGSGYTRVAVLTFNKTHDLFAFGLEIWRTVIGVFKQLEGNQLEEFAMDELDLPDSKIDMLSCNVLKIV